MDFKAIQGSKINEKTPQLEEARFYEKPCFCLVKPMIFSFEALQKLMIFQPETWTRNRALRNSKFHRFSDQFRTQNRPEKRCRTEAVLRRYATRSQVS